uniref:Uncharacterized protein n=1 Tax=Timema monikensis TaxID=170555 RepID=A0A7R9EA91_9NEOP|nr:unnamed protein product [Timema monikensis]
MMKVIFAAFAFAWRERKNHFGKITLSSPNQYLNLKHSVIGSLIY